MLQEDLLEEIESLRRRVAELEDLRVRFKETEEDLRKSDELFRRLFDQAPIGAAIVSLDYRFIRVNAALTRMTGYTAEELTSMGFPAMTHPEDLVEDLSQAKRLEAGEIDGYVMDKRYRRKDGGWIWIHLSVRLIRDQDGRPLYYLPMMEDITDRKRSQEALIESEQLLQATLDALSAHIVILDEKGSIFFVNDSWRRFARDNAAGLWNDGIGLNYLAVCDSAKGDWSEGATKVAQMIRELIAGNSSDFIWEYPCHSQSEKRWFALRATRFPMKGQVRVVLAHENITDRKAAEELLGQNGQRYRSVFENASIGIDVVDAEGHFVQVNSSLAQMLGYSEEELLNLTIFDVSHPEEVECSRINHEKMVRGEVENYRFEKRYLRKDGQVVWADVSVSPVRGPDGGHVATVGVIADITERKRAEEALRLERDRAREYFDIAGTLMVVIDSGQNVVRANKKACEFLECDEKDIIGKNWFDAFVPEEGKERLRAGFGDLMAGKIEPWEYVENPIVTAQGEERLIAWCNSVLRDEGGRVIGSLSSGEDITELRKTEKKIAEQHDRMKIAQDIARMGYWSFDIASGMPTWSDMMFEVLGCDPANGVPPYDDHRKFIHPDDWEAFDEAVKGAIQGTPYKIELRTILSDGSVRHVLAGGFPRTNESGQIVELLGITQDITDLKKIESALEASEAWLRETGRMARVGGWELYPESGEVRWTEETYRFHEVPFDEQPRLEAALKFFHPDDRQRLTEAIQKALDFGEPYDMELRFTSAKGKRLWAHTIGKAVRKGGKTVKLVGSFQDITEQRLARERLQRESDVNLALAELYPALLSQSSSTADIANKVLEKARLLTRSEHGYVSEIDEATGDNVGHTLTQMLKDGCEVRADRRIAFPKGDDGRYPKLYGHSLNTLETFFTNSPTNHPSSGGMPVGHVPLTRFLSVPVTAEGRLIGQIALANSDRDYTDEDIEVIKRLAHYYAMVLERKRWEEALRQSEQSLDLALNAANLRMWDMNLATGEISTSSGAWSLLGYPSDTTTASIDLWRDSIHPEDRVSVLEKWQQVIDGVIPLYEAEYRLRTLTGDWRWASAIGAVVERDSEGAAIRLSGTITDITQRKQFEQDARAGYVSFIEIVKNSGDGILVVNDEGQVLYANPSAETLFGREVKDLVGRPFGVPAVQELSEVSLIDAQGSPLIVEMRSSRTTWQRQEAWMMVFRDVTARRRYEQALKSSEERLRAVIESSPIGIKVVQDGLCTYANPAFLHMLGYERIEEVTGRPVEDFYHEDDRNLVREQEQLWLEGKSINAPYFERRTLKKTGEVLDVYVWLRETQYEGKPSLLGFIVDASKEKSLRAQLIQAQKMEAIGTLSGGIAHDFNNVLQVVCGFSELLLAEKDEKDRDYEDLAKIATAARRGAELVAGLLAFSRKAETKPRPVDLNREIAQVVELMSRTIPKMISIVTELAKDIQTVNADPGQVEQVLMNIIVNAKDAMPDGGRLIIRTRGVYLDDEYSGTHADMGPGEYVRVSVSDTGHGMKSSTVNRIFEPFFTTKQPGHGTGLGLAMVYGIMNQHGGRISCYSEPGRGTTFHLYWPVLRITVDERVSRRPEKVSGGTETILMVDDDQPVMDLANRILSRAGYTVLTAKNGREGMEVFARNRERIALVLLDLMMPEMGGKECLARILEIDPGVKVVLATGYMSGEVGIDPKRLGARALVKKPYEIAELLKTVRETLDEN